jgi:glutathione S-transferase
MAAGFFIRWRQNLESELAHDRYQGEKIDTAQRSACGATPERNQMDTNLNTQANTKIKLYSAALSMFGAKVQIALLEKGLAFDLVMVPFDPVEGYSPKHPEVVRINPKRQVPVLIHRGVEVYDSTQILEYLEDLQPLPALWPQDIAVRASARQLEHQSDEVYFPHVIRLMGFQDDLHSTAAIAAIEAATQYYETMEPLLLGQDYLAGNFSYADIAFYMAQIFGHRVGAPMSVATPRLLDWRRRMTLRPSVRAAVAPMVAYLDSLKRPIPEFLLQLRPGADSRS